MRYFETSLTASARSSGVKSIRFVDGDALIVESRRLGRKRLRGRIPLAGHVAFGHGTLLDGPDGRAGFAVEDVKEALLGRLRYGLDGAPVDGDVGEDRRAGDIHIPQTVMNELVVPLALAGLQVDGDEALAEESLAGAIAAVVVAGGQLDGQIDKP